MEHAEFNRNQKKDASSENEHRSIKINLNSVPDRDDILYLTSLAHQQDAKRISTNSQISSISLVPIGDQDLRAPRPIFYWTFKSNNFNVTSNTTSPVGDQDLGNTAKNINLS
jgi:hypothetical protein